MVSMNQMELKTPSAGISANINKIIKLNLQIEQFS